MIENLDLRPLLRSIRQEPDEDTALLILELMVGIAAASKDDLLALKTQMGKLLDDQTRRH